MAIIKITQKDIDKSKPMADGWHLCEIDNFMEDDTKDKQSKNWAFDLRCIEKGENEGRFVTARFNSKAPGFLLSQNFLQSALDDANLTAMEFDPMELKGKSLYANVKTTIYEGKPQKKTEEFSPASKIPF